MRRLLILLDFGAVMLFVAIGRDTHDEASTWSGLLETAAPFLLALAGAWPVARVWRHPESAVTGGLVAVITVSLGMVFRNLLFDKGTDPAFVVIASLFLGGTIIGWRLIAARFGQ